ncbi:MAG: hypothetical protein ACU0AT_11610 [Tranquillimonas sp.]
MIRNTIATAALCLGIAASPAAARTDTLQLLLGGRAIGTLEVRGEGRGAGLLASLTAKLNNTPLGVADGVFTAASRPATSADGRRLRRYASRSAFTSKSRSISILIDDGRAVATEVEPAGEMTALSRPDKVPAGIVDPATALDRLLSATGCPDPIRIYDGRRVVQLSFGSAEETPTGLICRGDYRVVAGPGHLSPLRLRSFKIDLRFDRSAGGAAGLAEIDLRTGPFALRVVR